MSTAAYGAVNFGFYGTQAASVIQSCPSPATTLGVCLQSPIGYFLSACADTTLWRAKNDKCTAFSYEAILLPFQTGVAWGLEAQAIIPRIGDLLHWLYVVLDRPAITAKQRASADRLRRCPQVYPYPSVCNPCRDPKRQSCCNLQNDPLCASSNCCDTNSSECTGLRGPWCNYVDELGFAALLRCALSVNGNVLDCLFNHFLHCWETLTGKAGKRLEEMIGKRLTRAQLVADSQQDCRLYVPLPFYFTEHSGQAFPLISCQFAPVQVHVHFAPLCKLIQVSDCDVEPVLCRTWREVGDCDMKACLQGTFIYLDMEERDRFALGTFNQLMTYVQSYTSVTNTGCIEANLTFTNPCIEMIWAVQRKCQFDANNIFDYSGAHGRDPIDFCSFSICGLTRFAREARFFRLCVPYEVHTDIPKAFVYTYSFATDPEGCENSGYLDLTRVFNAQFKAILQREIQHGTNQLYMFVKTFDILHFGRGLCCPLFR